MTDWDVVEKFISDSGYKPMYPETMIVNILLHWEGETEEGGGIQQLDNFLNIAVRSDMQSFDYD